mmetsp:Transcript_30309/g.59578  ORF Transcript_30309/g.59578 Transcript_30309/m.59578 type:complete len:81 (-) Transcript_30309:2819-3061(-)
MDGRVLESDGQNRQTDGQDRETEQIERSAEQTKQIDGQTEREEHQTASQLSFIHPDELWKRWRPPHKTDARMHTHTRRTP